MIRQVYFLRHGKAHRRASWPGDDDLRPLTEAGEQAVRRAARGMKGMGIAPDAIVASPLVRAGVPPRSWRKSSRCSIGCRTTSVWRTVLA